MLERWHCSSCAEEHSGIFHLGAPAPWQWQGPVDREPIAALRTDGNFLSDDLCVIDGEDFFVRGVLEIPVLGAEQSFGFGSWSTLSRSNFELYVDSCRGGRIDGDAIWTGWYASWPPPFPSPINQPCWVEPQGDGLRPLIWLEDDTHPLAQAQRDGITPERLFEIYGANGHSVDPGRKLH